MSKADGQYIAIRFTEPLIGNVSGREVTTTEDTAWDNTEFSSHSAGASRTAGLSFTPAVDITITALKLNAITAHTTTMHLWNYVTQAMLAQAELVCTEAGWNSVELTTPIELTAGTTYIVTGNMFTAYGYYAYSDTPTGSEHITYGTDYRINAVDTFPDTTTGYKFAVNFDFEINEYTVGNEAAFTVTGQEYDMEPGGQLVPGDFQVDSVEPYPVQVFWEMDGTLQLDGPGVMEITDSKCYTGSSITTLTGTVNANVGDVVLASATHRGVFTTPAGWELLYESPVIGTVNQKMVVAKKHITESGTASFVATQNISQSMYLNLVAVSGVTDIVFAPELESVYRGGVKPAPMPNKSAGERVIWGATVSLYTPSAPYGGWATTPDDLTVIHLDQASYAPRLVNLIDFGSGQATGRTINQSPSTTGTDVNIAGFRIIQEYTSPKICESETIELSGEIRVKWTENKPEGTDVVVEYTTGEEQGEWQEVSNGEVVEAGTNLWLRVTLSTEDVAVTPTLTALWLEESSAPPNVIRLVMKDLNRFHNVAGDLTVSYDGSGGLMGAGGSVSAFEQSFAPTDLIPKPDQNDQEHIAITSVTASGTLTKIYYTNTKAEDEHLEITNITAVGTLTHIDDI